MSSFGPRLRVVSVLALLIPSFFVPAVGQSRQSGEIRGTVTDQSQAALPGVKVVITNISTAVIQTVTTDPSGVYDAPYVAPGQYSLTFSKDAFKTLVRDGIELHVQTITINAALDIGMSSEKVTVTATQPDLETETTDTNTRFSTDLVADAPTGNRSWMDILASLPGVNPGWNEKTGGDSAGVNGQAGYFSNWQIDGGIAMFGQSSNADLLAPPIDSIEEVSANTANFGAEHGSGFSVFNVITKSGTNRFHGTVYEYIQNDAFNVLILSATTLAQQPSDPCASFKEDQKEMESTLRDWPNLAKYRDDDAKLGLPAKGEARIVFLGDSITEFWPLSESFPGKPYVNRGISGQTTPQMLLRFRQDVVGLQPKVVVILAGTNDIAENTGPVTLAAIEDNLASMVDLAKRNGVRVVLSALVPAAKYPWRPDLAPVERIRALNDWIKDYAAKEDLVFLDYHSAMTNEQRGLKAELSDDGVHPNKAGYAVMAPLAEKAIAVALGKH